VTIKERINERKPKNQREKAGGVVAHALICNDDLSNLVNKNNIIAQFITPHLIYNLSYF
jgi:hypothetical protein